MDKIKKSKDENFQELRNKINIMIKEETKVASIMQYRKSQEIILKKVSNENLALSYGISLINKKVITNLEKYADIKQELTELMNKYQTYLEELANYHDSQIVLMQTKLYEEELRKLHLQEKVYYLLQDEKKAKEKVDNSDDEIREKICDLEDELSTIEAKIRRMRPAIKKKASDKERELNRAIESRDTDLQKISVKRPRLFSKAKKFFIGKLKPHKLIEKDVFENLKKRLEAYENIENLPKKINEMYLEENIISTLDGITVEE